MPFEGFGRYPKNGKNYRVVGVDTFSNEDWLEDDFDSFEDAKEHAKMRGGTMTKMYVYDKEGIFVYEAGEF
ncbi:MAG: hypothetical protein PHN69_03595 [Candidatus Pacebacteria bacterium]|nr:hypothetical protein [Fermentimonas sp.]MDD4804234.1 hypothetical protein [Candidatus Paceibacterota bacterium]